MPVNKLRRFVPLTRTQFLVLLVIGYLGGYGYLRYSKTFVRIENKGMAHRNLILAPRDPWDGLIWEITKEKPILIPLGVFAIIKKPILNGLYWPLRKLESTYWTWTGP